MLGRRVVVMVAALIAAALCLASRGTALAGQRPAKQIPGTVALSTGSEGVFVTADALSCPAAGDCLVATAWWRARTLASPTSCRCTWPGK
jgi:hypothetical protein